MSGLFSRLNVEAILRDYPMGVAFLEGPAALSRDALRALQEYRFARVMARAWQIPFYQERWGAAGLEPGDISSLDDLALIPPISKDDLMASVAGAPPFGNFHGRDAAHPFAVFHTTSGTTGMPQPLFYGAEDREIQNLLLARAYRLMGLEDDDIIHSVYGFGTVNGGHYVREAVTHFTDALLVPAGTGRDMPSEQQVEAMARFGVTVLVGFVDYVRRLAEIAGKKGLKIPLRLVLGHFGSGDRQAVSDAWGGAAVYDWYGVGDTGVIAAESPSRSGLHVFEDAHVVEALDPETGTPVEDGDAGNLCATVLFKTGIYPIVRFDTKDLTTLSPPDPGSGINFRRMSGFEGRSDNMVKLRGINVYPTAIGTFLDEFEALTGEYVCRVFTDKGREDMAVIAEARERSARLAENLAERLKRGLGVQVMVELVAPGGTAALTQINERQKPVRLVDER
ncbi:MAG: phenylacetate--CoA ligase family protein [Alphaproteobacteria bacterium]|nr:phenylacetate--CoA ligase family protein [Alphaproteobacteria bacterium]